MNKNGALVAVSGFMRKIKEQGRKAGFYNPVK